MIMAILEFRARVCELYQKISFILDPCFKFLLSFVAIRSLSTVIGYDPRLSRTIILVGLSLICAFTPSAVLVLVCLLLMVAHVYSVNTVLSIFVALILVVLYCFFIRFTPKQGYVVIALPVLFMFRVPYLIPLLLGLTLTPLTILPMACGVFVYFMISVIQETASIQTALNADDVLLLFKTVVDNLLSNKEMLATIVIFALVITVVYIIRRMPFDYSFEISILVGVLVGIFGIMLMNSKLSLGKSMGSVVLFSLLSGVMVFILYFFQRVLDYTAVEHVQFEDDDYYYYVRAVPKINVGLPKLNIKRINEKNFFGAPKEDDSDDKDDFFDASELDRKLLEKRTREAGIHDRLLSGKPETQEKSAEKTEAEKDVGQDQ